MPNQGGTSVKTTSNTPINIPTSGKKAIESAKFSVKASLFWLVLSEEENESMGRIVKKRIAKDKSLKIFIILSALYL